MKNIIMILALLTTFSAWSAYKADISLDKPDGFYRCGEKAVVSVLIKKDGKPLNGEKVRLKVKREGRLIVNEIIKTDGSAITFAKTTSTPGWLYFAVEVIGADGKTLRGEGVQINRGKPTVVAEIGAIFDADKILTAVTRPADFDTFWKGRREALDKIPLTPEVTEIPSGAHNVKLYAVSIPCTGSKPATGYLAVPEKAQSGQCPAIVEFRGWVYGDAHKKIAVERAKRGMLSFYATWHGYPVGQPGKFYLKTIPGDIQKGELNIHDRDTWIMGDIYLRVMRIIDFMKSRPEWDRKTLVASGRSMGGAQAAVAAALDKDVTQAIITVPAFSEFDTRKSRRIPSIPHRTAAAIRNGDMRAYDAGNYFDLVNMAPLIKCEVFVATGFADELCPPSNVFAFYNALKCPKCMSTTPHGGHDKTTMNVKGEQWLDQLMRSIRR